MPLPAGRLQPVDVREVADRLVELALGQPRGRVRDLAGPGVRDTGDLARAYLRINGKQRPLLTGSMSPAVDPLHDLMPRRFLRAGVGDEDRGVVGSTSLDEGEPIEG